MRPLIRLPRPSARRCALALALLAGCGGGADSVVTPEAPPPPPPPVATVLAVATGDGQQAELGTPLTVRPTVVVRDATGRAMAGVGVSFAVDSGGGELSATTATTGADGTASSGVWTLGTSVGANVVRATVAGLPIVRFRAMALLPRTRTLIDTVPISVGGGTLRYVKAGDPLDGLTITVPPRAYATTTRWTVRADSSIAVTLPADFSQVGPVLVIANGQNYADSVITMTVPMRVAATDAVVPFYLDAATQTLEPITLVDRTDSSATLATRHFSSDMLALPRNITAGSALKQRMSANATTGFGIVQIVWVRAPRAQLQGTFATSFRPGVDDWEFENSGDYVSPGGICAGMSITAMFYHYFVRASGQPALFHRYDERLTDQWDNVQGMRFAGSAQGDYEARWVAGHKQLESLQLRARTNGATLADLTETWLLLALKLTRRPVYLALRGTAGGHAVVAYAATGNGARTDVSFADPNFPGTARTMIFQSGALTPVLLQQNTRASAGTYTIAYALGASAQVPTDQLSRRWAEFQQQRVGADRYPGSYRFEVYDELDEKWTSLGETVRTSVGKVALRLICPSCPLKTQGGAPDQQAIEIWNDAGSERLEYESIETALGTTALMAVGFAYSPFDRAVPPSIGFIDVKRFTVISRPFRIQGEFNHAPPQIDLDFMAPTSGLGGASPRFTWDFGDGTTPVQRTGDSTITHRWARYGTYTMKVELRDASGTLVARAQKRIEINNSAAYQWLFEETTLLSSTLPAQGIGLTRADTLIYQKMSAWITRLGATPENHSLMLFGRLKAGANCNATAILQEFQNSEFTDTATIDGVRGIVGSCGDPDYSGSLSVPPQANGAITGLAAAVSRPDLLLLPGGSLNAVNVRQGASVGSMTGTIVVNVRYSTGLGTYRFAFKGIGIGRMDDP